MQQLSACDRQRFIESLQSTIRKMEKALIRMREKNANTTLIEKRLAAMRIALALINDVGEAQSSFREKDALMQAKPILAALLPSMEKIFKRLPVESGQRTQLIWRIKSIRFALAEIEQRLEEHSAPQ